MALRVFNTATRGVEEFQPLRPGIATMYTCGPTVYRYAHLGNLRSYLMADWLKRILQHRGYTVHHIKNITDVGHMRQEVLEQGEDKVIAAALAEGKTPQDIARYYTEAFLRDEAALNILPASRFPRATDHIEEMVDLTERLLQNGHAYVVNGNVYFSVSSFSRYGRLSGNTGEDLLEGVRVEADPLKQDPRDFTLWKAAEPGRSLTWPSPWGDGFPGWHIECSAMSMKYLGERLDFHTGGVDNIFPHHEGEIAQSEGATGNPFVSYWLHGQHLLADGVKMAKSTGNAYTLEDLQNRGFDPLAFRYLCGTARYSRRLNFTFSALRAAERALTRLRDMIWVWSLNGAGGDVAEDDISGWREMFWGCAGDDLGIPQAIGALWDMTRSGIPENAKLQLVLEFDELLGLDLASVAGRYSAPEDAEDTLRRRARERQQGEYGRADALRRTLHDQGYAVRDRQDGSIARPMTALERRNEQWQAVSSSKEVESLLGEPDRYAFSVVVVACNYQPDVQRCIAGALRNCDDQSVEVVAVDNGSTDGTAEWLDRLSSQDDRVKLIHVDHVIGDASAKNIALKQSEGHIVVMLDTSAEVTGDIFSPLAEALDDPAVGVAGPFGLLTEDLRHFTETDRSGKADAMQGYCFAFRRGALADIAWMPETFRFYRNLDIHYSFCFKETGLHILADPTLPVRRDTHRVWSEMEEAERDKLSLENFRRFLKRFGHRRDLLVNTGAR